MLIKGTTSAQLTRAAKQAGVGFGYPYRPRVATGGLRVTLATVGPQAKFRRLSTVREWRGRRAGQPYQKTIPGAVCWHGHRDFMRALFKLAPDAIISTTLATYRGREDFERSHGATRHSSGRYFGFGVDAGRGDCVDHAGPHGPHVHTFRRVETLQECGSCGAYHRPRFVGDCRNDAERFPTWEGQWRCACGARQDRSAPGWGEVVTRGSLEPGPSCKCDPATWGGEAVAS